jgi:hypothetical protein
MNTTSRLDRLGDALREAAVADLARARAARRARKRRHALGYLVAAVVAGPGVAVAANALISTDEVARSIPHGTLSLLDTEPRCTTVRAGVEFDCTLGKAPQGDVQPGEWKGTVEPTLDDSNHVNGGCRSLNGAGTHWRCYVGQEAVRQEIIGRLPRRAVERSRLRLRARVSPDLAP